MQRDTLVSHVNEMLDISRFRDYAPNGLQVEGRESVQRIVTGVTASLAMIEAAIALQADAILVHHGYFWRNEDSRITGMKKRRIAQLLSHDINLLAYHLPLDAHPTLGNNARLGALLGVPVQTWHGEQGIIALGTLPSPMRVEALGARIQERLGREPLLLPGDGREIQMLAWCSGGAQGYFEEAIMLGADAYLTGEVSEPAFHIARESGCAFFAAGHHATEKYGIQALGEHLAGHFGLEHRFIDISNPV
ncbi:Nif3-like dinuclear metal center hexameric protein [Thermithiobacillus plumbiphilus]|uniref:Nif3-like dinuclear metal center hexameric protein n=1 Tax=Thermithiobacillus plumbiphilus TaxID=1729899 RepID=A0ABU9D602_9PROT